MVLYTPYKAGVFFKKIFASFCFLAKVLRAIVFIKSISLGEVFRYYIRAIDAVPSAINAFKIFYFYLYLKFSAIKFNDFFTRKSYKILIKKNLVVNILEELFKASDRRGNSTNYFN